MINLNTIFNVAVGLFLYDAVLKTAFTKVVDYIKNINYVKNILDNIK